MRIRDAGAIVAAAGWLLFVAVAISYLRSPDEACRPTGLWTSWWFFAPPAIGIAAAALTRMRGAAAALGLSLAGAWALAFPLWMLAAIASGASCGGG
jgi:hypothetical protein